MRVLAISTLLAASLVAVPASAQVLGGDVVGPTVGSATGAVGAGVGGGAASATGAIGGGVQTPSVQAPSVQAPNPAEAAGDVLDSADSATQTAREVTDQSVNAVREVKPSASAAADAHASHDQGHVSTETGVSVEAETTEPE